SSYFGAALEAQQPDSRGRRDGLVGIGGGSGSGEALPTARSAVRRPAAPTGATEAIPERPGDKRLKGATSREGESLAAEQGFAAATATRPGARSDYADTAGEDRSPRARRRSGVHGRETIETTPFARYTQLEYEQAREILAVLQRRLRQRLGRRSRRARRGRLDFRRTLHAAVQHGGVMVERRFRSRRPRHVDLLMLADISGSVHYASTLTLELIAGARECFRRVSAFAYIDRLALAEFEQGHLVLTPQLDFYARSDFGQVCAELLGTYAHLLTRGTVLLIIGDGRNNRKAPRVDLFGELSRRCYRTLWLNPEETERWNTGDSVIGIYGRIASVITASDLRLLEAGLERIFSVSSGWL